MISLTANVTVPPFRVLHTIIMASKVITGMHTFTVSVVTRLSSRSRKFEWLTNPLPQSFFLLPFFPFPFLLLFCKSLPLDFLFFFLLLLNNCVKSYLYVLIHLFNLFLEAEGDCVGLLNCDVRRGQFLRGLAGRISSSSRRDIMVIKDALGDRLFLLRVFTTQFE